MFYLYKTHPNLDIRFNDHFRSLKLNKTDSAFLNHILESVGHYVEIDKCFASTR